MCTQTRARHLDLEWDEEKRQRILLSRQIDILDAALMFGEPQSVLVWPDNRKSGEPRFVAIGKVDENWYELVFSLRGTAVRLITVWKLNEKTKRKAEARHARRTQGDENAR